MTNALTPINALDLTDKQTLYELAIEESELLGRLGAKLIADIKQRAAEAEYTHLYFRDAIRPGIIWFVPLADAALSVPTRGRLDDCRKTTSRVFPGFLEEVESKIAEAHLSGEVDEARDAIIMSQVPPITSGISGLDLAIALEYLVHIYPGMVRAWAALIFTYDEIIGIKEGAESTRQVCMTSCANAQIVAYLVSEPDEERIEV